MNKKKSSNKKNKKKAPKKNHKKSKNHKKKGHKKKASKKHKKAKKKKHKLTKASILAFLPIVVSNTGAGASVGTVISLLCTALMAIATAAAILALMAILVYCVKTYLSSRKENKTLTNGEAKKQAEGAGYKRVGGLSHGKPVYKGHGKPKFISPDQDTHAEGHWKGASNEKKLRKGGRDGTYELKNGKFSKVRK